MSRRFCIIIISIFILFIGGIALLSVVLPDRKFSEMENRNLQVFPEFSIERFKSGRYMKEIEDYISDQVAFREEWVGIKAVCERLIGKKENNGVYFGEDGTLLQKIEVNDSDKQMEKIDYVNKLVENVSVPVYFGLIPTAAEIWSQKLPQGAMTADERYWIEKLYQQTNASTIDFISGLEQHEDEAVFYRTDHHWTSLGAYYGANIIFKNLGLPQLALSDYESTVVSKEFYGTIYSKAGAWWVQPDEMRIYVSDKGKSVLSNFTGKVEEGRLYAYDKLEGKNKYAFFLGGNQPLCIVKAEGHDSKRLLLIRDSYSDALVPFLSEQFGEVHLFDLRYNRLSIKEYVEENDIDQIMVLYSFGNFVEDKNQFLLAH